MPAQHTTNENKGLIITTWTGEVNDSALIKALSDYQRTIRSNPDHAGFDEIVDFSHAGPYHLTISGIQRLVAIATAGDVRGAKTKLAIVVTSQVAYGLARMYQAYRSFVPGGTKLLRIFKTQEEALVWVEKK